MTASDIIAIVAIVISAIVSVASAIISYMNNKNNIEAKRSEIAFEKRLEAFSGIVKEIGKITTWTGGLAIPQIKSEADIVRYLNKHDGNNRFQEIYLEQRVFFPKHIDKEIREFINIITEFTKEVFSPFEKIQQSKN